MTPFVNMKITWTGLDTTLEGVVVEVLWKNQLQQKGLNPISYIYFPKYKSEFLTLKSPGKRIYHMSQFGDTSTWSRDFWTLKDLPSRDLSKVQLERLVKIVKEVSFR